MVDTITQEERALWHKDARPKSVGHYEPIDFEMDKRIRRLLTALEAAETNAARLKTLVAAMTELSNAEKNLSRLQKLYLEVQEGWHFGSVDPLKLKNRRRAARERLKIAREAEKAARRAVEEK